jgi:hypothetical protein
LSFSILLGPANRNEVMECSPLAAKPGRPGIKRHEGEFPLRPVPAQHGLHPIEHGVLEGETETGHIAAIMSNEGTPDSHKTVATLQEAVKKLLRNPTAERKKMAAICVLAGAAGHANWRRHSNRSSIGLSKRRDGGTGKLH